LGSEGADVRGRLVYRVTEPRQGGLTPRRHDMGDVHPVVHPDDSDVCDVRSTTTTSAGPDAARAIVPTVPYPVRWDQHYNAAVSFKMQLIFLMELNILTFTNNFLCSLT
jgi:hypothetical protein